MPPQRCVQVNRAKQICLLPPAPKVTSANVSGGGGSRSELVITWEVSKLAQDPWRKEPDVVTLCGCGPLFH